MGGNKTLVSSSDDDDDVKRRISKQESSRLCNGLKKELPRDEPSRKRGPSTSVSDKKESQKRRLNGLNATTTKLQGSRLTADKPSASPSSPLKPVVKKEEVETVKSEQGTVRNRELKETTKTRVKAEYHLPGQTRATPTENDPKKKFYVSLLEERPDSEMARRWCVTHGLLTQDQAEDYIDMQQRQKRKETVPRSRPAGKKPASIKKTVRGRESTPSTD